MGQLKFMRNDEFVLRGDGFVFLEHLCFLMLFELRPEMGWLRASVALGRFSHMFSF